MAKPFEIEDYVQYGTAITKIKGRKLLNQLHPRYSDYTDDDEWVYLLEDKNGDLMRSYDDTPAWINESWLIKCPLCTECNIYPLANDDYLCKSCRCRLDGVESGEEPSVEDPGKNPGNLPAG